jgi:hypothetical protein
MEQHDHCSKKVLPESVEKNHGRRINAPHRTL